MFQDVHWLARRLDAKGFSFCISFLGALVRSTNCNVELKRSLTRFFQLQSVVDVLVYLMYTISTNEFVNSVSFFGTWFSWFRAP